MIEKVREKNRQLDSFFTAKRCTFTVVNEATKLKDNFQQHIIVCSDINGLLNKIIDERQIDEANMLVRTGMDGGGGFLKVCLSVFEFEREKDNEERRIIKRFKNSGVKKAFVIAIVPGVQENFYNIKRIWHEAGMNSLNRPFTIATDFKLCNILLGLMSNSSSHPCCWCDVRKAALRNKGVSRTIQSLMDQFWSYFEAKATKKNAKEFGNVIHTNVFSSGNVDPSTLIILLVPPPELHLMMGPVNKMFDALSNLSEEVSEEWIKRLNIKREEYHGGSFCGNDSRRLLKNVSILEDITANSNNPEMKYFIDAFKSFDQVVASCFGKKLFPDYMEKIDDFKVKYNKLKISVTPKIHAVFHHVSEFCQITGKGLSPWSEQTAESIHFDFNQIWQGFKVRDTDHKEYGTHLRDAIVMYNSQHL